jgi:hypothetical protein
VAAEKVKKMAAGVEAGWRPFTDRVLFRGQADAAWGLSTTLQRATGQDEETAVNYYMQMQVVRKSTVSHCDHSWGTDGVLNLPRFEVKGIAFMV